MIKTYFWWLAYSVHVTIHVPTMCTHDCPCAHHLSTWQKTCVCVCMDGTLRHVSIEASKLFYGSFFCQRGCAWTCMEASFCPRGWFRLLPKLRFYHNKRDKKLISDLLGKKSNFMFFSSGFFFITRICVIKK